MGKEKLLRGFLNFAGIYFIFDALLHFSGIKLASVNGVWPSSAISYAHLLNYIYASFVILAALIAFIIQKDPIKYKSIIKLSAIWAIFHGVILLTLVWTQNYQQIFQDLPSLLVWLPIYREYLVFNAILLFIYSLLVYLWFRGERSF